MTYKITIEKTVTETKLVGKEWTIIDQKGDYKEYDYTPEIEKQVETRQMIYTQMVDDLDLVTVIDAVNKSELKLEKMQ